MGGWVDMLGWLRGRLAGGLAGGAGPGPTRLSGGRAGCCWACRALLQAPLALMQPHPHSYTHARTLHPAGNVLRQARGRLEAFWDATCAADGSFAWQAAQSFAMALMKTMQVRWAAGRAVLLGAGGGYHCQCCAWGGWMCSEP